MAQEQCPDTGANMPPESQSGDRLESLLISLIELKSSFMEVEARHPALGNDLSSLCGLVISHLERPDTAAAEPVSIAPSNCEDKPLPRSTVSPVPRLIDSCTPQSQPPSRPGPSETNVSISRSVWQTGGLAPKPDNGSRPANLFNRAGGRLIHGIDKAGDGIIFVLEKLASIGDRRGPSVQEEDSAGTC